MGPVQVFVLLAAISRVLGSDESFEIKPLVLEDQDDVDLMKPIWENPGTVDSARINKEKRAVGCGSYTMRPGQSIDIQSKNFPNHYPKKELCIWDFEVSSPSSIISIACKPFKIRKCKFSSLIISGGTFFKRFCRKRKRGINASSSNNQMRVVFFSRKKTRKGFKCTVSASDTTPVTIIPPQPICNNIVIAHRSLRPQSICKKCGTVNRVARIINGVETETNEFPWQAAIVYAGTNDVICSGVLHNDLFVLTSAECVKKIQANETLTEVLLGAHSLSSYDLNCPSPTVQRKTVYKLIPYSMYSEATKDNDIGILSFTEPAILNDFVKPACLPDPAKSYDYVGGVASGWGISDDGSVSSVLLKANVAILPNTMCQTGFTNFTVTENMMCAVAQQSNQRTCHADSGGPLVVEDNGEWVLVGLISSSNEPGCSSSFLPDIFTRVSKYLAPISAVSSAGHNNLCSAE